MEHTKTIASEELLFEKLNTTDWSILWVKLTARCIDLIRYRYSQVWKKEKLQEFSHDIIGDSIDRIFIKKTRKWNTMKYPDFEDFIVSVIDSQVNNALNKKTNEILSDDLLSEKDDTNNPELEIITKETRDRVLTKLQSLGADDDELLVFECRMSGMIEPRDIRLELGLSESEFHNIWRRLKRKMNSFKNEISTNGFNN